MAKTAAELTFADVHRFEETIKPPFRRALDSGRVDLLPLPATDSNSDDPLTRAASKGRAVFDERGGRLVVPLRAGQAPLGLLVVYDVTAEQLSPQVSGFLAALVETALEMVRLRLAAETDLVTGLRNEASFDEVLATGLSRLTPSKVRERPSIDRQAEQPGLSLLAAGLEGMAGVLERYGRNFWNKVMAQAARKVLEAAPPGSHAGRVGETFLVLLPAGASAVRQFASDLTREIQALKIKTPEGDFWRGSIRLGAATVDSRTWEGSGLPAEAAAVFKSHSLRALDCAARLHMEDVLFYGEILDKAGRVGEILPLDRLRLDLGRVHGLREGERFHVAAEEEGGMGLKAEIVVASVGEEQSVAELSALVDPTWRLRPGDRLLRLGEAPPESDSEEKEVVLVAGRKVPVLKDEVTGLAGRRSLMAIVSALCADEQPFAAVLVRVEGLEGMRQVMGRVGADSLMKSLAATASEVFSQGAFLGRHSPDTLAVVLSGATAPEAEEQASHLLERMGEATQRALRAGLAGHPTSGFGPHDVMSNAAKALAHAGFLEPGSVVAFDAVSLNVSGDEFFAQGRISEAVAEYERALGLDPKEPNVLNSLGVCYGHLGQTDKAMECFHKAMEASPEDFMAHFNLGYALMAKGKLAEARASLEKCLELEPGHADTLFQLGRLAQSEGRIDDALRLLTEASGQAECRPAVHRHLGEILAAAGEAGRAEEAFKQAVKVNSADAAALSGLAELYLARKANFEIALSLAKRARQAEPSAARHVRVMARALSALERPQEAADLLRSAAMEHPEDAFLALQLARVETQRGEKAAARDAYIRALALEPNLEEAKAELAELGTGEPEPETDQGQ